MYIVYHTPDLKVFRMTCLQTIAGTTLVVRKKCMKKTLKKAQNNKIAGSV